MASLFKAVLEVLVAFLERQATKPRTLEDANTPPSIRDRWAGYLRDKLRQPDGRD